MPSSRGSTKELLYTALLPPLIFDAALYLPWKELRRDLPVILVLATGGVLLSAGITALGMHYLAQWPGSSALVFGVLIAATESRLPDRNVQGSRGPWALAPARRGGESL